MIQNSFGLYIHWPFCETKCPYCDFNSHATNSVDNSRWCSALISELTHFASEMSEHKLESLYFGGGTPSLMGHKTVAALIGATRANYHVANDLEITIEANPSSKEREAFDDLSGVGVNRLSLGIQSFDNNRLRFLGRNHSATEAFDSLEEAANIFPQLSFDLLYALPDETLVDWQRELSQALTYEKGHISLNQLSIEAGTVFEKLNLKEVDELTAALLFELSQKVLSEAGLLAYEVSNHARPGNECRHNLIYWSGGDYVGCGPGAHGRITSPYGTSATQQISSPSSWLTAVEANGHGTADRRIIGTNERVSEIIMMGLRMTAGIDRLSFHSLTGCNIEDAVDPSRLKWLVNEGFLVLNSRGLSATTHGLQRLNSVVNSLLS